MFQKDGDEFLILRVHKTDSATGGYSANWFTHQITTFGKTPKDALLGLLEQIKNNI